MNGITYGLIDEQMDECINERAHCINKQMKAHVQQRQHKTTKHKQWTTTARKQNMECPTETRIGRNTNTTNNDKEAPTQKILNRNTYSNHIDYENNKINETRQTHKKKYQNKNELETIL